MSDGISEGVNIPELCLYLLVERSGKMVKRIYFSSDPPGQSSVLAKRIAAHLVEGRPCPQPKLDLSGCTPFQRSIYAKARSIPRGKTQSYGELAARAGKPRAARAVGRAMAANPFVILVPCHRVTAKSGLGGFAWGQKTKEKMLMLEERKDC
jgi:methylated-DNA-[protein]-cysteine S-methyltransferase